MSGNVLAFRNQREKEVFLDANELFERAQDAEERGDAEEALRLYRMALDRNPDMAGAHLNKGTIYFYGKDFKRAEECFRKALTIDPCYALAHYNLGQCAEEDRRRDDEAMRHYRECIRLSPDFTDVRFNLARLCEKHELTREALGHYRHFLKHAPADDPYRPRAESRVRILQMDDLHLVQPRTKIS